MKKNSRKFKKNSENSRKIQENSENSRNSRKNSRKFKNLEFLEFSPGLAWIFLEFS